MEGIEMTDEEYTIIADCDSNEARRFMTGSVEICATKDNKVLIAFETEFGKVGCVLSKNDAQRFSDALDEIISEVGA